VNDTLINIQDITVWGRFDTGNTTFKKVIIDSLILDYYSHGSLSDVLIDNSPIFIKSYGMGGLATPSFRGTGAGHTQVMWNGANLNSPMVGQSDLSLIPAGLIDDIQILYGGASLTVNSGGIGGAINIESRPLWKKQRQLTMNPGFGNFGRYTGLFKYNAGSENFQSVSKVFINSAENDFKYINSFFSGSSIKEKRKNAHVFQTGLMQEFFLKSANSSTSAHFWYQSSDRNLPSPMTVQQINSGEKQFDDFLRALLNHKMYKAKSMYDFTFSWFADKLNYINSVASIDSRNISHTISLRSGFEMRPRIGTILKASLYNDLIIVKSNNYDCSKNRNLISASASIGHEFYNRVNAVFLMRQNIKEKEILVPDFSFGFNLKLLNSHDYFIKGNVSRNSRVPTMNDMYWEPGGNIALKNEYSYTCEVNLELNETLSEMFKFKSEVTLYNNNIHDMIQWQPGKFTYWTPLNIGNVRSSGLEGGLELAYNSGTLSIETNAGYALTITRNIHKVDQMNVFDGKQLIYVPIHQINAGIKVFYSNFYSSWMYNFTGKRFITPDNSQFLPGYSLNDIILGLKINLEKNNIDISSRIGNVMGTNYQAIAYHPMPGRSVFIDILYKFTK
jgi:hypothetical protein